MPSTCAEAAEPPPGTRAMASNRKWGVSRQEGPSVQAASLMSGQLEQAKTTHGAAAVPLSRAERGRFNELTEVGTAPQTSHWPARQASGLSQSASAWQLWL